MSSAKRIRQSKPVDPFYRSSAWLALRRAVLQRDKYRCVVCLVDVSANGASRIDHIKPRSQFPELELVLSNCRTLCLLHDSQAHRERRMADKGERIERFTIPGIDRDGIPLDPNHPWRKGRQ